MTASRARAATGGSRPSSDLLRLELPRRHLRSAVADRRPTVSGRSSQGVRPSARRPLPSGSRSGIWRGSRRSSGGAMWPRSSSSRSRTGWWKRSPTPRYLRRRPQAKLCPAVRDAVHPRRDPDRTGAHGTLVRARALRARAGLRARGQGSVGRLHAGRCDGHDARGLPARGRGAGALPVVYQSTYGRNRLSMAAGLAAVRVIERDGLVEQSERVGGVLTAGLAELRERHELISDVRGSGLMIGIELGAPASRAARLNWKLIHLASEGLFPQLIVIPLHRDHRRDAMAAGKNDVIKLLPAAGRSVRGRGRRVPSARSTPCCPTASIAPAATTARCGRSRPRRCGGEWRAMAAPVPARPLRFAGRPSTRRSARSAW